MPLPNVPLRGNRRLVHALSAATALGVLTHAAFVLFGLDLGGAALYDQGAYHLALAGATALCAARATLVRAERAGWLALAAGMVCWLAGSVWWEVAYANDAEAPYPSIADALWLAFYPCAWAALVLMVRERVRHFRPSVWLDGLVGAFAFAALAAALVLEPILGATSGSFAAVATNVAYPIGDSVLGAFVVGVFALLGWRPGRAWLALGTGLLLLQVADSVYLVEVAHESYVTGTAIDILWPAGMAMLGIAAWQPSERRRRVRLDGGRMLLFPAAFALLALGLLIYGNVRPLSPLALTLASMTLLVAFGRTALAFREVASLAESRRQAVTDELTGLPNRRLLYERLEKGIAAREQDGMLAFLLVDLDGFKELNDTLGHRAGDILLCQVGVRMREALRDEDLLARLGGDEFGVLVPDTDGEAALLVARRVQSTLERPFIVDGLALHVEASIGAAAYPEHAADTDELIQRADIAMYQAKAAKLGCELYDADRDRHSRLQLALVGGLRDAMDRASLCCTTSPRR